MFDNNNTMIQVAQQFNQFGQHQANLSKFHKIDHAEVS